MARLPAAPGRFAAVAAGIAAVAVGVLVAVRHAPARTPITSARSPAPVAMPTRSTMPMTTRIVLHTEVPADITIPSGWSWSRFQGAPATIVFPLIYVSSQKMPTQCTGVARTSCWRSLAFPTSWRTPRDGVLVEWSEYENPTLSGHSLMYVHGRRTTIDHRRAKISRPPPDAQTCPAGTASQLVAFVAGPGALRFDMTACFGAKASPQLVDSVDAMLRSLDVRPK
jgi:hypothetical protein